MAGHRRRRLQSGDQARVPELPEPDKPLGEMTRAERTAYVAALRRTLRDDEVCRGKRPPMTMREFEIWRAAEATRDAARS